MSERPLWKVAAENYVNNGVPYPRGSRFESWRLPKDFVSLLPRNELAERIADYSQRVGLHHPCRPVEAEKSFLPAMLRVGSNQWTGPYCAATADMPRYDDGKLWLGWPRSKYERPMNEAAELVMDYWLANRRHPDIAEHGCWNILTSSLWLPELRTLEQPEQVPLDGRSDQVVMVDKPSSYIPLHGGVDAPMVPRSPIPEQPRIRVRRNAEVNAARRGEA
jgi:hypothetical protein